MLCRRAEMLPVECIVRGYLTGSAWKEYRAEGTMHGVPLPSGCANRTGCPSRCSRRRPRPRSAITTRTSASSGRSTWSARRWPRRSATCRSRCYQRGADWAAERGIIIADTKFELGLIDGELVLADEVLTPDSSRFWPADQWEPGTTPPSFDKQPVRDHLDALDWDKKPPPPPLPAEVVTASRDRYVEAYERITGLSLGLARLAPGPSARTSHVGIRRSGVGSPLTTTRGELRGLAVDACPGGRRRPRSGWAAGR